MIAEQVSPILKLRLAEMEDPVPKVGTIEARVMHRQGMSNQTTGKRSTSVSTPRGGMSGNRAAGSGAVSTKVSPYAPTYI